MRCSCYKCINNDGGYCGCVMPVEIDSNGECDCLYIPIEQEVASNAT